MGIGPTQIKLFFKGRTGRAKKVQFIKFSGN